MEIYLIRHTTPDIAKGICYGQSEVPLANNFNAEAGCVLENIPKSVEVIYTSPLVRCSALADFLSPMLSLSVIKDERLKELNFGDWEMKGWDDIEQEALQQWMDHYEYIRCPAGESYADLIDRVVDFVAFLRTSTFKSVAIITHSGVIKAFHVVLHSMSLKHSMDIQIGYGKMFNVQV